MKYLERVFLLLGFVTAIFVVARFSTHETAQLVTQCRGAVALVVALAFVPHLLDTIGLFFCLPVDRRRLGLGHTFAARLAGESVNMLLPTATVGGELVKVSLLSRRAPQRAALSGIATAYSLDALGIFVFAGLALPAGLPGLDLTPGVKLAIAGVIAAGMLGCYVFHRILRRVWAPPRATPKEHRAAFGLAFVFLAGSTVWQVVEVAIVQYGLGRGVDPLDCLAIASLAAVVDAAFFFVPGNIGTREGGLAGITALLGLGAPLGLEIALVRRVSQVVWAVIGYGCFVALGRDALCEPASAEVAAPVPLRA